MLSAQIGNRHALLERCFADAILSDDAPIPSTIQIASGPATASRFGVYRNNVLFSLMKALASRYPVTRNLLWPETFDGAARLFVAQHPPRPPVLLHYGDDFPQFLRRIGIGPSADYIADIAALETARVRAYHAVDSVPLSAEAFAAIAPEALPNTRFTLHPSLSLVRSRFPIVSAWEAARHGGDVELWKPEAALVVRPDCDVMVWRLPPGGYEFFEKLAEGGTIAEAAGEAAACAAEFDLAPIFNVMICAGAVIGIMAAP